MEFLISLVILVIFLYSIYWFAGLFMTPKFEKHSYGPKGIRQAPARPPESREDALRSLLRREYLIKGETQSAIRENQTGGMMWSAMGIVDNNVLETPIEIKPLAEN